MPTGDPLSSPIHEKYISYERLWQVNKHWKICLCAYCALHVYSHYNLDTTHLGLFVMNLYKAPDMELKLFK